jgi:hypothetical protein
VDREGAPSVRERDPSVGLWAATSHSSPLFVKCDEGREEEGTTSQEVGAPPHEGATSPQEGYTSS